MRNRTLIALLLGEVVSSTGSAMTFVALPWFVLSTSTPLHMSVVLAVEILPLALFGLPSGSLVQRLGARRTMLAADLLRAPLVALVPVLYWTGDLTYGALLVIVFALGCFTAPYIASQRTVIPEVLGDDETLVAKASGLFGGASQLPIVIGPAIAGILVALLGAPALLLFDAVTFLFAFATVLFFVRAGKPVPADEENRGVLAGVRYLTRDRLLGPLALTIIVLDGAANALAVAVPLLAYTRYDRDSFVAGWIFTGFGIGAVAGSLLVVKLLDRFRPLRLACVGIACIALPLWVIAVPVPWPVVAAATVLCGLCVPLVNAPMMGLLTTRPPEALRAKVMTAVLTASGIGAPVGRVLVGPVFHSFGNTGVWIAIAGGMTVGAVLFIGVAVRSGGDAAGLAAVAAVAHGEA
jgi:MFS family permease